MSGDRVANILLDGIMLILPVSALMARRLPLTGTLKMALAWVAIFAVALALVSQRERLSTIATLFSDQRVDGRETRIQMANDGHFWADVTINGVPRRMLVDSGATTTALTTTTAAAAKVDVNESPFPALIGTANGSVSARTATVSRLIVGSVIARDVGVVVSPSFGETDVLGMNFLSRLGSWRVEGKTLILIPSPS